MKTVKFTDFRKNASELFTAVERGETLLVLRHGKPIAEVSPALGPEGPSLSWKKPGLRLAAKGADLSAAILRERRREDVL
jgi:antitoxin (DNA-binding transcriptional repressor) of toxin-antitoxin stability system